MLMGEGGSIVMFFVLIVIKGCVREMYVECGELLLWGVLV